MLQRLLSRRPSGRARAKNRSRGSCFKNREGKKGGNIMTEEVQELNEIELEEETLEEEVEITPEELE